MTRKALPSVLLHKSEVTYRDTGVSKKRYSVLYALYSISYQCYGAKVIKNVSSSISH